MFSFCSFKAHFNIREYIFACKSIAKTFTYALFSVNKASTQTDAPHKHRKSIYEDRAETGHSVLSWKLSPMHAANPIPPCLLVERCTIFSAHTLSPHELFSCKRGVYPSSRLWGSKQGFQRAWCQHQWMFPGAGWRMAAPQGTSIWGRTTRAVWCSP